MTAALALETKSAPEANFDEVKTALDGLTADIAEKHDELAERLAKLEAKANRPAGEAKADNDNEDLEAKALNEFLRTGSVDHELKALTVGTPADGGYTTAPEYSTTVIQKITEINPMRRLASSMAIGAGKIYIPTLESDAAGTWVSETGARQESQPTFGQVEIDVYEHAVIIPVSRQLLEDSFLDLQGFLAGRIANRGQP